MRRALLAFAQHRSEDLAADDDAVTPNDFLTDEEIGC